MGFAIWFPFAAATIIGTTGSPRPLACVPVLAFLLLILVRPWFMGVQIRHDTVVIRGWFLTHRLRAAEMTAVSWRPYCGMLNGGNDTSAWGGMLVVRVNGGREREYPSTISSRSGIRPVVNTIRRAASLGESDLTPGRTAKHLNIP